MTRRTMIGGVGAAALLAATMLVGGTPTLPVTVTTDSDGTYSAEVPAGGPVWITPRKHGEHNGGVSSLDAAWVLQAVAGLRTLTPLQRLACDATGDGSLSALDATRLLQRSAGVIGNLPVAALCDSDWLFIPRPDAPGNPIAPVISGGECSLGRIEIDPLVDDVVAQNFDAMLLGDCTGNWRPMEE